MASLTESVVEDAALAWLEAGGWQVAHGPDIAPDTLAAERRDYGEAVLAQHLRDALARLNPELPAGQAGEGDADGARAGGLTLCGMGDRMTGASNNNRQRPALRAAADAGR